MKSDLALNNNAYLQKLKRVPRGLTNKVLAKYELEPFFEVVSLEDLLVTLHQFATAGYFKYQVILSSKYDEWEKANNAVGQIDRVIPDDPLLNAVMNRNKYELHILGVKIKSNTPLSRSEINTVIKTLPRDMAERFLCFKLRDIDQKKLKAITLTRQSETSHHPKIDNHVVVGHKGLIADGTDVSYKGEPIKLGRQQAEILRVFLKKPYGAKLSLDDFSHEVEVFDPNKQYDDLYATLSKLIPAMHKKLMPIVGRCIFNKHSVGWYLKIG